MPSFRPRNSSAGLRSPAIALNLGGAEESPLASSFVIFVGLAVFAAAIVGGAKPLVLAPVCLLLFAVAVAHRVLLSWKSLLTLLILVVLFIPIRRYALPAGLPFDLEP